MALLPAPERLDRWSLTQRLLRYVLRRLYPEIQVAALADALVQKPRQIVRDRHWRKRADPCAARVAQGHPDAREDERRDRPCELTAHLSTVSQLPAEPQHPQMRCRVREGEALTQDVGPLQVPERLLMVALCLRGSRGGQLLLVGGFQ